MTNERKNDEIGRPTEAFLRHSSFVLRASFVIRHSCFVIPLLALNPLPRGMIVSWIWRKQYVPPDMPSEESSGG